MGHRARACAFAGAQRLITLTNQLDKSREAMTESKTKQPLRILAHYANPSTDGSMPFAGLLTTQDGDYVATVSGILPKGFLDKTTPVRRRGRPKNESKSVAYLLHELICKSLAQDSEGLRITNIRAQAAEAIGVGPRDDQEEAAKYIRRQSGSDTAKAATADFNQVIVFQGDAEGSGRLGILLRKDGSIRKSESGLIIHGVMWICQWGDSEARHCRANQAQVSISEMNPNIDQHLLDLSTVVRRAGATGE